MFGMSGALHFQTVLVGATNRDTFVSDINAGSGYYFDLGFLNIRFDKLHYTVVEGDTLTIDVLRCGNRGKCMTQQNDSRLENIVNFDTGDVISTDPRNQLKLTKLVVKRAGGCSVLNYHFNHHSKRITTNFKPHFVVKNFNALLPYTPLLSLHSRFQINKGYNALNQLTVEAGHGWYYEEEGLWLDPKQVRVRARVRCGRRWGEGEGERSGWHLLHTLRYTLGTALFSNWSTAPHLIHPFIRSFISAG